MALINIRIEKVVVEQDPEVKKLLQEIIDKLKHPIPQEIIDKLDAMKEDIKSTV
jgi:hypothetical protein